MKFDPSPPFYVWSIHNAPFVLARAMQFLEFSSVVNGLLINLNTIHHEKNKFFYSADHTWVNESDIASKKVNLVYLIALRQFF